MKYLDYSGLQYLIDEIKTRFVQQVEGKTLTTNDFTNVLQSKLARIETGAQVNKVTSVNSKEGIVVITSDDIQFLSSVSGATPTTIRAIIDDIVANNKLHDIEIGKKADKTTTYTKTEIDGKFGSIDSGVISVNSKSGVVKLTGEDIESSSTVKTTLFGALQALTSRTSTAETNIANLTTGKADLNYVDGRLGSKVDKVAGKSLSTNDYTDIEKVKLGGVETGAQANIIELIKRNGTNIVAKGKAVDIAVPTKISDLTNDRGFKTETEIKTLIQEVGKLKKEVVTALPSVALADDNTIYLVRNKKGTGYEEWLLINGVWEIMGDTAAVDFTGYVHEDDITKISNVEIDSFLNV